MDSKVDKASDKLRLSYTLMIRLLILVNKKTKFFPEMWSVNYQVKILFLSHNMSCLVQRKLEGNFSFFSLFLLKAH